MSNHEQEWASGGFDEVTCGCGATFSTVGEMVQHAQVAHGVDVD